MRKILTTLSLILLTFAPLTVEAAPRGCIHRGQFNTLVDREDLHRIMIGIDEEGRVVETYVSRTRQFFIVTNENGGLVCMRLKGKDVYGLFLLPKWSQPS